MLSQQEAIGDYDFEEVSLAVIVAVRISVSNSGNTFMNVIYVFTYKLSLK